MSEQTKIYAITIEPTSTGYSAYAPDIPGCASVGDTEEEVVDNLREAIEFHFEGLARRGIPIPKPSSQISAPIAQEPEPVIRSQQLEVGLAYA